MEKNVTSRQKRKKKSRREGLGMEVTGGGAGRQRWMGLWGERKKGGGREAVGTNGGVELG